MAKTINPSDQEQVTAHINQLDPEIAGVVEMIRQAILGCSKDVGERIKWNNPSFSKNPRVLG